MKEIVYGPNGLTLVLDGSSDVPALVKKQTGGGWYTASYRYALNKGELEDRYDIFPLRPFEITWLDSMQQKVLDFEEEIEG